MAHSKPISPMNYLLAFGAGVVLVLGGNRLRENIQSEFRNQEHRKYSVTKTTSSYNRNFRY